MVDSYYEAGQWNAICDTCGVEYKSGQLKKQWDGIMACPKCFDHRHPQEFVRGVKDQQSVPWTRPEATDTFTAVAQSLTPVPG